MSFKWKRDSERLVGQEEETVYKREYGLVDCTTDKMYK